MTRLLHAGGCSGRCLSHYRRASHYRAVVALVEKVFAEAEPFLVSLNVCGLAAVCRYIGLPFRHRIASALHLALPPDLGAGGWAPAICAALGATGYVNPAGGEVLFDPAEFAQHGIELQFLHARPFSYETGRFGFEPGLSVLDVLMWNEPGTVLQAVRDYRLCAPTVTRVAA